jgi:dTDP-glucose 4,6-dehydratase
MKLLILGGAGFIGSNFIHYFLEKYPDTYIVNYDKLTYAGNLDNLAGLQHSNYYTFIKGDITNKELVNYVAIKHEVDTIINFAAESHVDRSYS